MFIPRMELEPAPPSSDFNLNSLPICILERIRCKARSRPSWGNEIRFCQQKKTGNELDAIIQWLRFVNVTRNLLSA